MKKFAQISDFPHSSTTSSSAFTKFSDNTETNNDKKTTKISIDLKSDDNSDMTTIKSLASNTYNLLDDLKSTSLIIRTMRSANNFDEALKDLEAYSHKNVLNIREPHTSAFKLVRSNSISKSNSANNIFKDPVKLSVAQPKKYAASLDGDRGFLDEPVSESDRLKDFEVLNEILEENKRISLKLMNSSINKSNHLDSDKKRLLNFKDYVTQNSSSTSYNNSNKSSYEFKRGEKTSTKRGESLKSDSYTRPIAAPRMKKLTGSSVLSQQLSQLKRLYDAANEDNDSDASAKADEEVKLYLGNLSSSEEKSTELSGSWSRVKAKRNTYKQQYLSYKNEHNLLEDKWTKKGRVFLLK